MAGTEGVEARDYNSAATFTTGTTIPGIGY